jgi:type IV secretion system protein VirB1
MTAAISAALALTMAAQCAPGVAPETTVSIAQAESGLDPLAVRDNTTGQSYQPAEIGEAIAIASDLILAQHHSVDLGLMQVTSANLVPLGLSIADAFDVCRSMAAGGQILSSAYRSALTSALSTYNTGNPTQGIANGYVARVVAASAAVPPIQSAAPAPPAAPAKASKASPSGWDVFASSGGTPFVFTSK